MMVLFELLFEDTATSRGDVLELGYDVELMVAYLG